MPGYKDLNNFITHVKTIGLPTASHFQVLLPAIFGGSNFSQGVAMLCDDLVMPGVQILTNETRTMGELSEIAYGITYPPVSMTFLVDNNFNSREYFDKWTLEVYDRNIRAAGFYSDYAQDIVIDCIDKAGKTIYSITLIEAYPKTVSDLNFSNSSHDVLKISVQFIYKYWEVSYSSSYEEPLILQSLSAGEEIVSVSGSTNLLDTVSNSSGLETLQKAASSNLQDFSRRGLSSSIGPNLAVFGDSLGADLSRGCKAVAANGLGLTAPGNPSFGSGFTSTISSMGNKINAVGSTIGEIGRNIRSATAPLSAIGNTVNSFAGTIGQLDSVLKSVGIKNTGLGAIAKDVTKIGSDMNKASRLGGFPGKLGSLGGSMGALGNSMQVIKKSFDSFPDASDKLKNSIGKLGDTFSKKGVETANAAGGLKSDIDNGVLNA